MKNIILFNTKKVWSVAIVAVLFLTCFLTVNEASAADPKPVDGRIIPTSKTGDTSAWVEIANYNNYALIIRQDPLTSKLTMYRLDKKLDSTYSTSELRKELNNWYKNKLAKNARLRSFAVKSDAPNNMGYYATKSTTGQSKPNGTAAPTGDDVAFALSFSEALYFCSTQYQYQSGSSASIILSSTIAHNNFHKLRPSYGGGGQGDNPSPAYWLRSPGSAKQHVGAVAFQGGAPKEHGLPYTHAQAAGRVNQHIVEGAYCHYRPAMWVGLGLIEDYSVTYNPNGGTGSVKVEPVDANTNYTIKDQGYTRAGYTPNGWNTQADGKGVNYTNGQNFLMTTSLTLYAQWKQVPVSVTYYPNGGEGSSKVYPVDYNTYYKIADQGYTWSGTKQTGWNTKADGTGYTYSNGDLVLMTTSLTLYAQWKPALTVTYDPNGGEGRIVTEPVDSNYYTIRSQGYYHSNSNYTFDIWNTKADGTGTSYTNDKTIYLTNSIVLFAQWKLLPPKPVKVTCYPNGGIGNIHSEEYEPKTNFTVKDLGYYHSNMDYEPDGWNTRSDGIGTKYSNGDVIYLTGDIELYAQWKLKPVKTVSVIYEPNGGAGVRKEVKVNQHSYYTIKDQGYTKELFSFAGWNTMPNGHGVSMNNEEIIIVPDDIILYAQWKRKL